MALRFRVARAAYACNGLKQPDCASRTRSEVGLVGSWE